MADGWIERARRHALLARELDEIASMLIGPAFTACDMMADNHFADRLAAFTALCDLAEAERQERDRLMQAQDRADA